MKNQKILAGLSILVAGSLLMAACSSPTPTPATATVDANAIYTQAAQTVQAGISKTEAAKPTQAPTETPAPTNTMDPTAAAMLTSTAQAVLQPNNSVTETPAAGSLTQTPAVGQTPGALATNTPFVLATATQAAVAPQQPATTPGDKCEWVANSPKDGTQIQKKNSFDTSIVVKNTGTTTWSNKYALRFFGGERMGAPSDYYIQEEVTPGEMYKFVFPMTAPDSTGKKEALFVVQNAEGSTMCWVNIPLEIID